jgi:hypothetical protein
MNIYITQNNKIVAKHQSEIDYTKLYPNSEIVYSNEEYPLTDGVDKFGFSIPKELIPSNEEKLETLRQKRNKALADTDWMMASDTPLTVQEKADITAYRQSLRDITEPIKDGEMTVDEVVMPIKP